MTSFKAKRAQQKEFLKKEAWKLIIIKRNEKMTTHLNVTPICLSSTKVFILCQKLDRCCEREQWWSSPWNKRKETESGSSAGNVKKYSAKYGEDIFAYWREIDRTKPVLQPQNFVTERLQQIWVYNNRKVNTLEVTHLRNLTKYKYDPDPCDAK